MKLISSVWRPGSGAQWVKVGLSVSDFKTADTTYFEQGLRLVDFELEGGQYTGVWRPGSGAQCVRAGLSWSDFKAQDLAYFNLGLRIVDIEIDGGKYAAVWRPGTGAQWVQAGLTWDAFKTQDLGYFKEGLRLVDIEIQGGKFTGVWRPGTGAQWVHAGISPGQLVAQDAIYGLQGLRIHVLKVQDGALTAVWRPGTGAQALHFGLSVERFAAEDTAKFKAGLRLQALEVHERPVIIYRLPFADASGWALGKGNWDDPQNGHSQGDPLGWQAYAYDFLHDEEGAIRAARAGTVYDLDESSSQNGFNPNDPCNPGVGNYLVIKHDDGTFGVYWHMKHDGVLVTEGQSIAEGDQVALSGNTGNSSAPHLHFDARIGWDLAYSCSNLSESPGLPVFFEDKNHSYWRPRVDDSLAPSSS